jgi:multidrug efflux pump subunit AcrA (membrane-fusion protein)
VTTTPASKGDLLLRIDPRDYLTAVAQAQAQLALAQAQLNSARMRCGSRACSIPRSSTRPGAAAGGGAAQLALAPTRPTERQHEVDRRATTRRASTRPRTSSKAPSASLESAKAQVAIARLVPEQMRRPSDTVAEREAQVQQAQAQLDQANLNLSYTEVRAPSDGFITMRSAQLGGFLATGSDDVPDRDARGVGHGQLQGVAARPHAAGRCRRHRSRCLFGIQARGSRAEHPVRQRGAVFRVSGRECHRQLRQDRAARAGQDRHRPGPGPRSSAALGLSVSPVVHFP